MTPVRLATLSDIPALLEYFSRLGPETRSRFAPHAFDDPTLHHLLNRDSGHIAFVAINEESGHIIGYAVARLFYEDHEKERFQKYGWTPNDITDVFYAPSVADEHQGKGIGQLLMAEARQALTRMGRSRILLWGGVQASNDRAVAHYRKAGFTELGRFEWNGSNLDMALDLGT